MRRDKGGGQSQIQGAQEVAESLNLMLFLNLQYKAGPHTHKAETTAKITRQDLTQLPDRRDISLYVCVRVSLFVCLSSDSLSSLGTLPE